MINEACKGPGRQRALKNHHLLLLCSSPIITRSIQSRYYYPYSTNEGNEHNITGASMILMIVFPILIFKVNTKSRNFRLTSLPSKKIVQHDACRPSIDPTHYLQVRDRPQRQVWWRPPGVVGLGSVYTPANECQPTQPPVHPCHCGNPMQGCLNFPFSKRCRKCCLWGKCTNFQTKVILYSDTTLTR